MHGENRALQETVRPEQLNISAKSCSTLLDWYRIEISQGTVINTELAGIH